MFNLHAVNLVRLHCPGCSGIIIYCLAIIGFACPAGGSILVFGDSVTSYDNVLMGKTKIKADTVSTTIIQIKPDGLRLTPESWLGWIRADGKSLGTFLTAMYKFAGDGSSGSTGSETVQKHRKQMSISEKVNRLLNDIVWYARLAGEYILGGGDPVAPSEKVPIDITKANTVSTTIIQIKPDELDRFRFNLEFRLDERKTSRKFYDLRKLVGAHPNTGKKIEHGRILGTTIPVKITIDRLVDDKENPYHDKIYFSKGINATRGQSLIRQITIIHLLPGKYAVRLENLRAIPDVPPGTTVFLDVQTFSAK